MGKVFETQYRPSPIPKGGLEISNIDIELNYLVNFEDARPIDDGMPTSIVEDFDDDSEEDFLVDDDGEDDDVICID